MRIRTRSFVIILSQGVTQITQVLLWIVLVRLISKEMLGSYRQIMLVYALFAGILSLQLESSLYYFIPKLGVEKRRQLILQTLIITLGSAGVIGSLMFLGSGYIAGRFDNPSLVPLIRIFALYPFVDRIIVLVPAFLISLDRAIGAGLYSMLAALCRVVLVVIMFIMGRGLYDVLWVMVGIGGIFAFIGCVTMFRLSSYGHWRISRSLLSEQFYYCWPLLATTMVGILNIKLDGFLISIYFSPDVYAVYSCGAMELPIIGLVTVSLSQAIMPNMVVLADQNRHQEALYIWQEAARKASLIVFPCFLFFLVTGYDFIVFLYSVDYEKASWPFLIYLGQLPFRVAVYSALLRAIGHTRPIAKAALLALVCNFIISVTLLFLGQHGFLSYVGPSIGTVCSVVIIVGYLLLVISRKLQIPFFRIMRWKELGRVFGIGLICGLLLWLIPLPETSLLIKLMVQSVIYFCLFVGAIVVTNSLKEDEKELFLAPLRSIWAKRKADR
jgi:O-antigen/teichoic acid export membrane protein